MKEDILSWKATVVKIPFVNKRGTVIEGMADLYLQKDNKITLSNFGVELFYVPILKTHLGKEITVELSLRKGNLDTDDSNRIQQSRVGEYVLLHKIAE